MTRVCILQWRGSDITPFEQLIPIKQLYPLFLFNDLIPVSKKLEQLYQLLEKQKAGETLFQKEELEMKDTQFECIDTTNVDSGEKGDLNATA